MRISLSRRSQLSAVLSGRSNVLSSSLNLNFQQNHEIDSCVAVRFNELKSCKTLSPYHSFSAIQLGGDLDSSLPSSKTSDKNMTKTRK